MEHPYDIPSVFGSKLEVDSAMERIREESGEEARPDEATAGGTEADETPVLNYAPDAGIIGMVPAPGWEMVYLDETGEEATARLVAWAMTDEGVVRGLIVASNGAVVFGDTVQDFRGYNDRGENADVATALEALHTMFANLFRQSPQGVFPAAPGTKPVP